MISKIYEIEWEGIKISISHTHKCWGVIEHLEIRSTDPQGAPLPITQTGYESHFVQEEHLSEYKSPADYVLAWLEHEASKPEWEEQKLRARQYSLF